MTSTGVAAFDKTIEKTIGWLNELQAIMGWKDRDKAYMALRAVLHAVRDRLLPEEAVDFAAQLPMLMRGFFYEGWHPGNKPLKYRHKQQFLEQVAKEAPWLLGEDLERAVTAVFEVVSTHIKGGEPSQVRHLLPPELRELWAQPGM